MTLTVNKRRLLQVAAAGVLLAAVVGLFARLALTGMAVNALLQMAGASEIRFRVTGASPWRVMVEEMEFKVRTQEFAARRVSFVRSHWWTPSLGAVRVEQARMPVTIDGSDTNPLVWSHYQNGTAKISPAKIPAEEISLDGQLVIKAAALPEQTLAVKIAAHLTAQNTWEGQASADGPGLGVIAAATYDPATKVLAFQLPEISLDLKPWQSFVQRLVLLPGGAWELEGKLTGSAAGRWAGKSFAAGGRVALRAGLVSNKERAVAAAGVEADLEFTDLDKFESKPGTLRVRELQVGKLAMRDIDAEFAFGNAAMVAVTRATLKGLGGSVTAEPFRYFLNQRELDVVLLADGIDVEQVMALTKDLPAKASGRVNGRLPVHIDEAGFRLGTGWLALKPGVAAQIQFNAAGLLTNGVAANSPSYAVLKKIESGLLKLKVGELRLEIRPPNAPPGRSAQLHVAGEPVDPEVKAPVTLDLNVNGALEKLINLGLDSRLSFGGSKP